MPGELSQEDQAWREVHERFGRAMYEVQAIEGSIKLVIIVAQFDRFASPKEFEVEWAANLSQVLGQLIQNLRPYLAVDHDLESDLQLTRVFRNQLVHHFFWDHADDVYDAEGMNRMLAECEAYLALFKEVNARLRVVADRYIAASAVTPEWIEAEAARRRAATPTSDKSCGRCSLPMEAKQSGRHRYFQCANCGSVALT